MTVLIFIALIYIAILRYFNLMLFIKSYIFTIIVSYYIIHYLCIIIYT